MSVRRLMLVVACLAINAAVLRSAWGRCYTAFDTGPRGWPDPGYYAEVDIGPCRLVYQSTKTRGRWLEYQGNAGSVVLFRAGP